MPLPANLQRDEDEVTPERVTSLWLDIPQYVLIENPWAMERRQDEIGRGHGLGDEVERNAAGGIQQRMSGGISPFVHENVLASQNVLGFGEWFNQTVTGDAFRIIYRQAPSTMTGATTGADPDYNVSGQGDPWIAKSVNATMDVSSTEDTADLAAFPKPVQSEMLPLRRVGSGISVFPALQGFLVRFYVPATQFHAPDNLWTFYWGGPTYNGGGGEYAATFTGDGLMKVWVRLPSTGTAGGSLEWYLANIIRYSPENQVMGQAHSVIIEPYQRPASDWQHAWVTEFRTSAPEDLLPKGSSTASYIAPEYSAHRTLFCLADAPLLPPVQKVFVRINAPSSASGPGPTRIDIRQDQCPEFQIAQIIYDSTATFNDDPFYIEETPGSSKPIHLWWSAVQPAGCSVDLHLYNADDNTELTLVNRVPYAAIYQHPAAGGDYVPRFYVQARFTNPGTSTTKSQLTGALYGYVINKDGYGQMTAPNGAGIQAPPASLQEVQITGYSSDPTHDSASCEIEDQQNALAIFDQRSSIPARIETTSPWDFPGQNVILHRGYVDYAPSHRVGHDTQGGVTFPNWKTHRPRILGEWVRLHEQLSSVRVPLASTDIGVGTGSFRTMKITDFIRRCLYWAGYPPNQVDVPDAGLVFAPTSEKNTYLLEVNNNLGEVITGWLQRYLGWYLCFDPNAGSIDTTTNRPTGMWRVHQPPYGTAANGTFFNSGTFLASSAVRYTFTTESPSRSGLHSLTHPAAYPANTTFIFDDTMDSWTVRPEGNALTVYAAPDTNANSGHILVSQALNLKSANFLDGVTTADPTSEDYLGRIVPVRLPPDAGIIGQGACDLWCRQVYRIACHGRKMKSFVAPLVFIQDSADTITTDTTGQIVGPFGTAPAYAFGQPRPLRYYDIVRIIEPDGVSYGFTHSCNPDYDFDGVQTAYYEVQVITPNTLELPALHDGGD